MERPKVAESNADPVQMSHPGMPSHAAKEAEFLALVDEGLADIDAGHTIPFETVSANFKRKMSGQA